MNREHVVGCPALRAGVRCTCQIVPSSRVKPPTRVEEIRRKFPNMVGTWGAEAITFLLAENERLREHVGASGIAYAETLRKRAEQAEAENERLRAEVTFFDGQHAAAMETVGELSDRVEHAEARTRALEAVHTRLRNAALALLLTVGRRGDSWMMSIRTYDALTDLRAALTEPAPPREEPR